MNSISSQPTGACIWLQQALAAGAVESVQIKALAEIAGVSPKALRTARERLRVLAKREGNGTAMRSIWSLPAAVSSVVSAETGMGHAPRGDRVEAIRAPVDASAELLTSVNVFADIDTISRPPRLLKDVKVIAEGDSQAEPGGDDLTDGERDRVARRVQQFVARGLDAAAGRALAIRLVVERDRTSSRAGSCIECECLNASGCRLRISAIVDAHFSLIVDGQTA